MRFSRRDGIKAALAVGATALAGCGPASDARADGAAPAKADRTMLVHRDPGCGCCSEWARQAASAGYRVRMSDSADMAAIKRRLGVPGALAACHTAEVGGLVFEGHVPLTLVARLLAERPAEVRGLAVPGMPMGSPGMEAPAGGNQAYEVHAFDARGRSRIYARIAAS